MLFPRPEFLLAFLPIALALVGLVELGTRLARRETRAPANLVLLATSLLFYAWGEGPLVVLMLASIAGNYAFGLWIAARRGRPSARGILGLAIAFDLGLLGYFKYANFAVDNANRALGAVGLDALPWDTVVLPIGISFFTFQAMSYVIDVYRGDAPVQRDPFRFATYIALFPQLIAGPIVRYRDVAAQLAERAVGLRLFESGARRFVIGLGKKTLIADPCAEVAAAAFGLPGGELTTGLAWLGAIAYTLQIYFDFSGYSDMAIGLGRMFGFRFLENFRWPYVAQSITEFWRRWHVSLSSWFRDYLYIPLGGNRRGAGRTYFNLFTVFFLCGLWHGASWNFVAWGLYHGAFLVLERLGLGPAVERAPRALRHAYVLLVVVVGWVFFNAADLSSALAYLRAMALPGSGDAALHPVGLYVDHYAWFAMAIGAVASAPWLARLRERGAARASLAGELVSAAALALVLVAGLAMAEADTFSPFIYFRF